MTRSSPSLSNLMLLSALASCLVALPASSATLQFFANVDGAQANSGAGTGSSGTGTMSVTLDDVTNGISWSGAFSGLGSPFTVAHFHGPAAANQSAGVILGTAVTLGPGNTSGTSTGTGTLSAANAAALIAGNVYWNVHSGTFGAGELRGNLALVPEPGTALLLMVGLAGLAMIRQRGLRD